jgi:hypothetical protein
MGFGKVELNLDDNKVTYTYEPVGGVPEKVRPRGVYGAIQNNPRAWRELTSATIAASDGSDSKDLIKLLPAGCRIFYHPDDEEMYSSFSVSENCIEFQGNLGNPFSYYALTHESGHAVDVANRPESRTRTNILNSDKIHAESLRYERNASAFTLFHLRRFMSDNPAAIMSEESVRRIIYQEGLQGYSDGFRWEQEHPLRSRVKRVGKAVLAVVCQ